MAQRHRGFHRDFVSAEDLTSRMERQRREILLNRRPGDTDETIARRLSEGEQDLLISAKLGDDFPNEKRDGLMAAYRRMQEKRNAAVLQLVEQRISAEDYAARLQAALDDLAAEYSRVLTPEEYRRLLGEKPGEPIALPLDPRLMEAR